MAERSKGTKRSGQITLRVSPALHTELVVLADALGLDVNELLRLMIARSINHYRIEAELLRLQTQENVNLLNFWRDQNPGRPIREFWEEYWRYWQAKKMKQTFEAFTGFNFDQFDERTPTPKGEHQS